jgi:hypothetical protein
MEIINWIERHERDRDDIVTWLIVAAATRNRDFNWNMDSQRLEITFQVNGQDMPFVETLKEFEVQFDRIVEERAGKMLDERLANFMDDLDELRRELRLQARTKLGIEFS